MADGATGGWGIRMEMRVCFYAGCFSYEKQFWEIRKFADPKEAQLWLRMQDKRYPKYIERAERVYCNLAYKRHKIGSSQPCDKEDE